MRNVAIVLAVAAMALSSPAYGDDWLGGSGPTGFENAYDVDANWEAGVIPATGTGIRIGNESGATLCRIERADVAIGTGQGQIFEGATLEVVNGYDLTMANYFYIGKNMGDRTPATLSQDGGLVQTTYKLTVGSDGDGTYVIKDGTFNMTLAVRQFFLGTGDGTGTFRVEGTGPDSITIGTYEQAGNGVLDLVLDSGAVTQIDLRSTSTTANTLAGELKITGTTTSTDPIILMEFNNTTGRVTGTFGTEPTGWTIDYNVDSDNDGNYEVTATIPEPATMVLLGIGGIGVLIRRRRNRK